jgi:aminoglycoside 6'-N-acetyltransferase I
VRIAEASARDADAWLELRLALWPGETRREEFAAEIAGALTQPGDSFNLIAHGDDGEAVGFAEASLRHDYVNGCETSPVAFLEGIYVAPAHRRRGIALRLVAAIADWARKQGCSEFASDAAIDNLASHRLHESLGFAETQRVVYFRKELL